MEQCHVFLGAGPANLHRALCLLKNSPDSQIVIIDPRLELKEVIKENNSGKFQEQIPFFDREKGRTNIFRLDEPTIVNQLYKLGVDKKQFKKISFSRNSPREQHLTQAGDEGLFSPFRYSTVQIRDLEALLLEQIVKLTEQKGTLKVLCKKIEPVQERSLKDSPRDSTTKQLTELVQIELEQIKLEPKNLIIHNATGAGALKSPKNNLDYNYSGHRNQIDTSFVEAYHATCSFQISNQPSNSVTCPELNEQNRSLDHTPWREKLGSLGWSLVRPPRVRIFYCHDVLYIGTEIPAEIYHTESKEILENKIEEFARTVAKLAFGQTLEEKINNLPAYDRFRNKFQISRAQRGQVTFIDPEKNITCYHHGDRRYLPHYQTGSGFVTAFHLNELFSLIEAQKTFEDLFKVASEKDAFKKAEEIGLEKFKESILSSLSENLSEENTQGKKNKDSLKKKIEGLKEEVTSKNSFFEIRQWLLENRNFVNPGLSEEEIARNPIYSTNFIKSSSIQNNPSSDNSEHLGTIKERYKGIIKEPLGESFCGKIGDLELEKRALELWKHDLFSTLSQDILSENKELISQYNDNLSRQELYLLAQAIQENHPNNIRLLYLKHHKENSLLFLMKKSLSFRKNKPDLTDCLKLVIKLLESGNEGFQKAVLPHILNAPLDRPEEIEEALQHKILAYKQVLKSVSQSRLILPPIVPKNSKKST